MPLIHNVMNTDVVVAVSDRATDQLEVMFNTRRRARLPRRPAAAFRVDVLATLGHFGLSSICNVLAAITTAKLLGLGADDAIVTVATDGGAMYPSEREKVTARDFGGGFTDLDAAAVWGTHLADVSTAHTLECTEHVPQPDLQPRLLHLGRAAGHARRAVRGAPRSSRSGPGCAATSGCGTR